MKHYGSTLHRKSNLNGSSWTLSTDDTILNLTVMNNRPAITRLMNPEQGWNWAEQPAEMPLFDRVIAETRSGFFAKIHLLDWKFLDAETNASQGMQVTLKFVNESPKMELRSIWIARPGPGPIEHMMTIRNNSGSSIMIFNQESLDFALKADEKENLNVWYVNKDAGAPFLLEYQLSGFGVYIDKLTNRYNKDIWTTVECNDTGFIPWMSLDCDGIHGLYVGWECNYGRINISGSGSNPIDINIRAGLFSNFGTELKNGEIFEVPGAFIGTYKGEVEDGSNRLRKWLYNYMMPEINRRDTSLPTVLWNAFWNTGETPGSWLPVESKYYPMVDAIAEVGIEEVAIDTGWWEQNGDWRGHSERWPSGMAAAGRYAHEKGLKYCLYFAFINGQSTHPEALTTKGSNSHPDWFCGSDRLNACANLGVTSCEEWIRKRLDGLFDEYIVDTYRSDFDPVISNLNVGGKTRMGKWDTPYWAEKGFLSMLDYFYSTRPGFKYQNCSGGGSLKSYAIMKRSATVQVTDFYNAISVRQSMFDSSYCFPMMQLMGPFGDIMSGPKTGTSSYRFRHFLFAAPMGLMEHPGEMSDEDKNYLAKLIKSYKRNIRPLIRTGDVYHIFPRPDGVNWDGMEYYDPNTEKGVSLIFKPDSNDDNKTIKLKGLNRAVKYKITFEDGTNPETEISGQDLLDNGINVELKGTHVAEWMFFEAILIEIEKEDVDHTRL